MCIHTEAVALETASLRGIAEPGLYPESNQNHGAGGRAGFKSHFLFEKWGAETAPASTPGSLASPPGVLPKGRGVSLPQGFPKPEKSGKSVPWKIQAT